MTLPKTIERPDDVPEIVRDHYAQKDGAWTLTLLSSEEVAVTVAALDKERKTRRDIEAQLLDIKTQFEGIDPAEVVTLREKVKSLDDKKYFDDHGLEELRSRWTHEMKTDYGRQLAAKDRELLAEREQRQAIDAKWRRDKIDNALLGAAARAGVAKYAMDDAVDRGRKIFLALDDKENPIAKDGDEIKYGKDGVTPFTPDEYFLGLKADAPHLWPPSSGGGATPTRNGAGGVDYSTYSSPTERLTAYRQAQAKRG